MSRSSISPCRRRVEDGLGARRQIVARSRRNHGITVAPADYLRRATTLHDASALKFEQLIDLCGVDY